MGREVFEGSGQGRVVVFDESAELAPAAADRIATLSQQALGARGCVRIALAGGSTPKPAYALVAEPPYRDAIRWSAVAVFWGDERCVRPDHPESNYRMVQDTLLSRVPIPSEQVHRMRGEVENVDEAAQEYEETLRTAFGLKPGEVPRFDLILLGLGPDGHTASLFPGTAAIRETRRWVVGHWVQKLLANRLTLTPPLLNAARHVLFLVSGATKADVLREVLEGPADPNRLPAQIVRPTDGTVEWLLDRAAASHLNRPQ
jgi:6-phosphogluconolactonase